MNIMKLMCLIQDKENIELLLKEFELRAIKIINTEHNCGYDRAQVTLIQLREGLMEFIKEKGII